MGNLKVGWPETNGYDLHLLAGTVSPRLDHRLFILDDLGTATRVDKAPGVTVAFTARFAGAPSDHGVTMDPATGEITVAASLPAPRLRSFLVTAKVNDGAFEFGIRLRVHVHATVSQAWLTPDPLTVREGGSALRLTLLARFDDGVIGDITNWSPWDPRATGDRTFVRRTGSNDPILTWISRSEGSGENFEAVDVGRFTGALRGVRPHERATVVVTHPAGEARAKVDVDVGWAVTATQIEHLAGPGFAALNDPGVPNILILPDGFSDGGTDRRDFRRHAEAVVGRLTERVHMRPFDLLLQARRLNWFTAWVPSRQAGITVGRELDRLPPTGPVVEAKPLEQPTLSSPPFAWTLPDLVNEVGLPAPAHDLPGSPLGTQTAGRLRDWRTLYGTHITAATMAHVHDEWLARGDRVLLNERDTAFHIMSGHRPRVDGDGPADVTLNPRRVSLADLDTFLDNLTIPSGNLVPKLWSRGARDQGLVLILCRTHSYAGFNAFRSVDRKARLLAVSLLNLETHRIQASTTGPGFDVVPDPVPAEVHPHTWTTTAHELAHSWGLGDEYGGHKLITSATFATTAEYANVQPRKELLDGNGRLGTGNLKWRWPRIAAAGVTAAVPVPVGDRFTVRLRRGHAKAVEMGRLKGAGTVRVRGFKVGDVVRLRSRPLVPVSAASPRLRVTAVRGDELELAWVTSLSAVFPMLFPAGSIVLLPVRARDPAPGVLGDDLELVAASVRARIDATHNPLNANPLAGEVAIPPVDAPGRQPRDVALAQPTKATNWPGRAAPNPPRYSSWLIGAYENGNGDNDEFVHPSGVCLMNEPQTFVEPGRGTIRTYQFCHVCRYGLVDRLDPTMHGRMDRDYDPRYPA